jgi:hypothetical protein
MQEDFPQHQDAGFEHVAILANRSVVTVGALARLDGAQNNRD